MRTEKKQYLGMRYRGEEPGKHWEIDFTEVRPGKYGYRYLLVLVDTFSGWVEAFPTKEETAIVVAKKILKERVTRYGLPVTMGSDNGPAFVTQIVKGRPKLWGQNGSYIMNIIPRAQDRLRE